LSERQKSRTEAAEMNFLGAVSGYRLPDNKYSENIRKYTDMRLSNKMVGTVRKN
jgi:hypothetical protein